MNKKDKNIERLKIEIEKRNISTSVFDEKKYSVNQCEECSTNSKCILHTVKDDWYKVNSKGVKVWNKKKVDKFWTYFNKKIQQDKFQFTRVIFPKFNGESFEVNVKHKLTFIGCIFLDDIIFFQKKFFGAIVFLFCKIQGRVAIHYSIFDNILTFTNCEFEREVSFKSVKIRMLCSFTNTVFKNNAIFFKVHFYGNVNFSPETETTFDKVLAAIEKVDFAIEDKTEFLGSVEFITVVCEGVLDMTDVLFYNDVKFAFTSVDEANFIRTVFSENHSLLFSDIAFVKQALFVSLNLNNNRTNFRRVYMENVIFNNSNFEDVNFEDCVFKESKGRIVIGDEFYEIFNRQLENHYRLDFLHNADPINKNQVIEDICRQYKNSMNKIGNYELASKFHISEMLFKERRLNDYTYKVHDKLNRFSKILHYTKNFFFRDTIVRLILLIYSKLSRYGESPGRVVLSMLFTGLIFSILFKSIQDGFQIFLPFRNTDVSEVNWLLQTSVNFMNRSINVDWLIYDIAKIFALSQWALLIISIRKKFRY